MRPAGMIQRELDQLQWELTQLSKEYTEITENESTIKHNPMQRTKQQVIFNMDLIDAKMKLLQNELKAHNELNQYG